MQYFEIDGYWKDDPENTFSGYVVKSTHDVDEETDDKVFFYGLEEHDIQEAIELGINTCHEFVITDYRELEEL